MIVELEQQRLKVQGKIDFKNANTVYEQGKNLILQNQGFPIFLDLSHLEIGNTIALAIFVQWLRLTPQNSGLKLISVPEQMMKIISSCSLEQELGIKKAS